MLLSRQRAVLKVAERHHPVMMMALEVARYPWHTMSRPIRTSQFNTTNDKCIAAVLYCAVQQGWAKVGAKMTHSPSQLPVLFDGQSLSEATQATFIRQVPAGMPVHTISTGYPCPYSLASGFDTPAGALSNHSRGQKIPLVCQRAARETR